MLLSYRELSGPGVLFRSAKCIRSCLVVDSCTTCMARVSCRPLRSQNRWLRTWTWRTRLATPENNNYLSLLHRSGNKFHFIFTFILSFIHFHGPYYFGLSLFIIPVCIDFHTLVLCSIILLTVFFPSFIYFQWLPLI